MASCATSSNANRGRCLNKFCRSEQLSKRFIFVKNSKMAVQIADDSNFQQLLQEREFSVVKYHADWCGNCKLFAPKFKRVSNEEAFAHIGFIEVDAEKNPEARRAAGVDSLPYLALFNRSGLLEGSASSKEEYLRELIEKADPK